MYWLILPLVIFLIEVQSKKKNCQQTIFTFEAYPKTAGPNADCKTLCAIPGKAMFNTVTAWNGKTSRIEAPGCIGDDGVCVTFTEPDTSGPIKNPNLDRHHSCICQAKLEIMRWRKKSFGQDSCGTNDQNAAENLAVQLGTGGESGLKWKYVTMKTGKSVSCSHHKGACQCMYTAGSGWPPEQTCLS